MFDVKTIKVPLMAQWIEVYPTSDIHLIAGESWQIDIRDWSTKASVKTGAQGTVYTGHDPAIATVADANFTGVAEGETICRVTHTDGTAAIEALIRIRVHTGISALWIGNERATIFQGADNYVLTVFAKFDDGSFGDLSCSPNITWSSADPAIVEVDAQGRLHAVGATGANTVITVTKGALNGSVTAFIRDSYATPRSILQRIHGSGTYSDKKNILILPEGFASGDRPLFDQLVQQIKDELLVSSNYEPYHLLQDNFNVWTAFEESPESGVTPGMPVKSDGTPITSFSAGDICSPGSEYNFQDLVRMVGLPDSSSPAFLAAARAQWDADPNIVGFVPADLTLPVFTHWRSQIIHNFVQAKDSLLGIKQNVRWADRSPTTDTGQPLLSWYLSGPVRRTSPDRRRLYSDWNRSRPVNEYIDSLRVPGLDPAHPNFNVKDTWLRGGNDEHLVCLLVNDNMYGGTNFGRVATSIGRHRRYSITDSGNKTIQSPSMTAGNVPVIRIAGTLAHEFAHSFKLGDEYEGYDNPNHRTIDITNSSQTGRIERFLNLTHFGNVQNVAGTQIDASKTPWNWHRIDKIAITQSVAVNVGAGVKVQLKDAATAAIWGGLPAGTEVYLRNADLNKYSAGTGFYLLGPLTVDSVSGNEVSLSGGQPADPATQLPAGSQLYEPAKSSGNELRVVDPAVIAHITGTGNPFMPKADCSRCDLSNGLPDSGIAGFTYPRYNYEVLGLYEGGGTFNCKVYRPAGVGKMRSSGRIHHLSAEPVISGLMPFTIRVNSKDIEFSFVDKYVIVNAVNPEKLSDINPFYPT